MGSTYIDPGVINTKVIFNVGDLIRLPPKNFLMSLSVSDDCIHAVNLAVKGLSDENESVLYAGRLMLYQYVLCKHGLMVVMDETIEASKLIQRF